jgi:hypothetical protein
MKKLILPLILVPFLAFAQDEMREHDKKVDTKFLTVVKDAEVEKLLGSSAELNECRDYNKFDDPKKSLAAVTTCINGRIGKKDSASLKKLAEDLKLQDFGVIKSKNVSEITAYLSKKMHKALTGQDPDDKNPESQKWENQKIVDQKVFIELYKNQLAKNALFEISRYCFENLRLITPPTSAKDFSSYWQNSFAGNPKTPKITHTEVTDVGDDGNVFFKGQLANVDLNDEKIVYEKLISGLNPGNQQIDSGLYAAYFNFCKATIKPLCDEFKKDATTTANTQAAAQPAAGGAPVSTVATLTRGSSACLTFNKLEAIRATLRDTEKVARQFDEMDDKGAFALKMIKNPKIYQNGKGAGEQSLDELTSVASSDFLGNNEAENDRLAKLETQCATNSTGSDCEQFLQVDDGLDKALNTLETNMQIKRDIEIARVKKLNGQSLKDYLKENRHFDLLERLESQGADKLTEADIESEITKFYDAKKLAEIEALKFKVGKRQVSKDNVNLGTTKEEKIQANITESKEERARLAQVVMFNNIITSQLDLEKKTGKNTYQKMGRNVSGWNKEKAGMDSQGINQDVFKGIQQGADDNGVKTKESIAEIGFLDQILGKDTSKENED